MLPLTLSHWDFYFLLFGLIGLYAIHRLNLVAEEGEIDRSDMVLQVAAHTRRAIRNASTIAGLRSLTFLPAGLVRDARLKARLLRARRRTQSTGPS